MKIELNLAVYLPASMLEYLQPKDLTNPEVVGKRLSTWQVDARDVAGAAEEMRRWSPGSIILAVVQVPVDLDLSVESLALAGAKAFQDQAAAIRAEAHAKAAVLDDRAAKLLAIEYTAAV